MKLFYSARKQAAMLVLAVCCFISFSAKSQLTPGGIAFTGYHSQGTDKFSFVLLVNMTAGQTIKFTDNAWVSTNNFTAVEGDITWTVPAGGLVAGREITIDCAANTATLTGSGSSAGTVTGTNVNFNTSGDQIFAYHGTLAAPTSVISGLHMNVYSTSNFDCYTTDDAAWDGACASGSLASLKPSGPGNLTLTTGTNALWVGSHLGASPWIQEWDNGRFNCTGPLATAAQVRTAVNNKANWTVDNSATPSTTIPLPSGCAFLASIFPLDIISFTGNNNNTSIGLNWQSANEPNDRGHFEIEKSVDGVSFSRIGQVNNQGFSYLPNNYAFTDNSPVNGANFYRLKIVSDNGMVKYSVVVKVLFGKTGRGVFISPNPAVTEFTVSSKGSDYTQLVITDRSGRAVMQQRLTGNNNRVDVSNLPAGQYSVTLFGPTEKTTEKLLIVH